MTHEFLALLPGFALYSFAMSVTPGPNNVMLVASGANFGVLRTVPHGLGIAGGFGFMFLMVGLGLGALFLAYPLAQSMLKIVGLAYILWLAWKIATAGAIGEASAAAKPLTALQAAAFQWINVKAWMIAISAIGVYTTGAGHVFAEALVLSVITAVLCLPAVAIWAALGASVRLLLEDPGRMRLFNITMAVLLIASVLPILF